MSLKHAVVNLINNMSLFARYWAEADLSMLNIPYHFALENNENGGSMDIVFVNLNEFDSIERAIVTIVKKHVYYCQEWEANYANDTTEAEWREYLLKNWLPIYFACPIFDKYSCVNERMELNFNYSTIKSKEVIKNSYWALYDLLSESEVVHFNDESVFVNYFITYNKSKSILSLYFWCITC